MLTDNLDPKQSDKVLSFLAWPQGLLRVCTELGALAEFHNGTPADFPVNTSPGG